MAVKAKILDTEIAFRDLTRTNKKLRHQHTNPDALRRRFTDFVILSQKLTGVMRKEYADLTGGKWEAKHSQVGIQSQKYSKNYAM